MRREHLPIVTPCDEDWSAMTGDAQRRHCSSCALDVLHLSAMTAEAARRVLEARRGERVCVRYACDADDNVVFAAPLRAVALASALAACSLSGSELERVEFEVAATTEQCETGELEMVAERPGEVSGVGGGEPEPVELPGPQELPGPTIDVLVEGVTRVERARALRQSEITMGISVAPVIVGTPVFVELPRPRRVGEPEPAPEPEPPRRVRPMESQMGALVAEPLLESQVLRGARRAPE